MTNEEMEFINRNFFRNNFLISYCNFLETKMSENFEKEQKRYDNLCPTDFGYEEEADEKLDYEDEDERQVFDESFQEYLNDHFENESIENAWEKRNKL